VCLGGGGGGHQSIAEGLHHFLQARKAATSGVGLVDALGIDLAFPPPLVGQSLARPPREQLGEELKVGAKALHRLHNITPNVGACLPPWAHSAFGQTATDTVKRADG
jgi:hypothetical protein